MGEQPMLLYTNTMQIRDTLTPDAFIALAIQWNQGSSWSENVIRGISWNGEHSVRFGTDEIWMAIEEYRGGEIIAVRYQKTDEDDTAWISDFVMDFADWELTVRLYQNFPPDKPGKRRSTYFVPPYFPRLLIDHGYVLEDGSLPVAYEPILIRRENVSLFSDVITGEQQYRLPVVYVSRTTADEVPIKASDLAYQLKGAAHVMVQESVSLDPLIRTVCHGKNTYHGAVGVYLPDGRHYRFFHGEEACPDRKLFRQVFFSVVRYWKDQPLPPLRTWDSIHQAILLEQQEAEPEVSTPAQPVQVAKDEAVQTEVVQPQTAKAQPEVADGQPVAPEPEKQADSPTENIRASRSLRERIRSLFSGKRFGGDET